MKPENIPENLSDTFTFEPRLLKNGEIINSDIKIECALTGASYASAVPLDKYIELKNNEDGTFTLLKVKKDITMSVSTSCEVVAPDNNKYQIDFSMRLSD